MSRARGFTLIEIVVVLFILGVVLSMALSLTRAASGTAQVKLTTAAIANADAALLNFVIQMRRLPCPADGALPASDVSQGLELVGAAVGTCTNSQARGVVPWRTLGISMNDVTDGYGNLLTYRVDPLLTVAEALNLSDCDVAGGMTIDATKPGRCSACSAAALASCTSPIAALAGRGLMVQDQVVLTPPAKPLMDPNATPPLGAAYVVVSHGATMARGYTNQNALNPGIADVGAREVQNAADLPLQVAYMDTALDSSASPAHFDDILSRPSVLAVVNRAGLGPRQHQ